MIRQLWLFLLVLPNLLFAQQKECVFIDWSKNYGGTKADAANDMQATADGGFVVAGYARSADEDLTNNKGGADYWVVKIDSLGSLEWQQNYGGADNDNATSILQLSDGGFLVAGGAVSFDGQVQGNHGEEDAWILRLDGLGNIVWKKAFGGTLNDRAESIQPTSDGNFIVSGYSQSSDGDLTGNQGEFDYWVFKITGSGDLLWQRNFGGSLSDFAFDAVQTSDGGFLIAGSSFSDDGDVSLNQGFYDYWLVKLDATGNLIWEKSYGGIGEERAYGIALSAGGAFIAGTSNSGNGDVPSNNGGYDFWVMKIELNGNLLWSKNLGGSTEDRALGLASKSDGGVLITGLSTSSNLDVGGNFGSKDAWLVNLDENGQTIWEKNFGGSLDDRFFSVLELLNGGFACAGYTASSNQDLTSNYGQLDMWVIKLSPDSIDINLGNDTILCAGQGIILDAGLAGVNYLWVDGSNAPVLLVSSPGEYWVEIDKQGCLSRDTVIVEYVSETPVNIGNDTILCDGEILVLDPGIPGAAILWKNGSSDPTLSVQMPGSIWVEVSKNGCEYRDTIEVNFTTVPIELGENLNLCIGETAQLNVELPDATYIWHDGSTGPVFEVLSAGLVWVEASQGGCSRRDSVEITYQDGPVDPFPDFGFICKNEGVWLNVKHEGATYNWQDGSTEHNFKAVEPGFYWVQVEIGGCIFEDELELRPCEQCLYVPNAFSPNGDGINDEFRTFAGCEISNYRQYIYDRWGTLVFESNDHGQGWDGLFGGKKSQQGSYVFRIEFDYLNNGNLEHQTRTGTVALIR